ncbi:MAG: ABC transporter permease [Thermodesulfobacteriota bacterium]|nr:ABC transporter permease [Thermodesulfobacteriota bacterium]
MDYIFAGFLKACGLIFSLDQEVLGIALLSLRVSAVATFLASIAGIPIGFIIGTGIFRGKRTLITLFNTLMAFPTVVVGLLLYSFISRQGPLGALGLLFTPWAMVIGQFVLATPIIVALTISATQGVDSRVRITALSMGANRIQTALTVLSEARFALISAVIAGFGRVITEVGCALMVGGNIRGYTRTMTTAIALETAKGDFAFSLALGFVLLIVAFWVNIFFNWLQGRAGS